MDRMPLRSMLLEKDMRMFIFLILFVVGCTSELRIESKKADEKWWHESVDFRIKAIQEQRQADREEFRKRLDAIENRNEITKQRFIDTDFSIDLVINRIKKTENLLLLRKKQ